VQALDFGVTHVADDVARRSLGAVAELAVFHAKVTAP
jgi:hypothetical protein